MLKAHFGDPIDNEEGFVEAREIEGVTRVVRNDRGFFLTPHPRPLSPN